MKAEELYDYPKYYEIAFGFRGDCENEINFFEECIKKYSDPIVSQ